MIVRIHSVASSGTERYQARSTSIQPTQAKRDRVYWLLVRWKGAAVLRQYVSALLERVPDIHFRIVGPATDRTAEKVLKSLSQWPGRCLITKHLPRTEALETIGGALCVFCPDELRGWGAIGDAWNMGTPVVWRAKHVYGLVDGQNALVTLRRSLLSRPSKDCAGRSLWNRLVQGGLECVRSEHSVEVVAAKMLPVVAEAAGRSPGAKCD